MALASGWYSDPADADVDRYWDGQAWTDRVRPAAAVPDSARTGAETTDAASSSSSEGSAPVKGEVDPPTPRRRGLVIAAAVAVLALVSIGIYIRASGASSTASGYTVDSFATALSDHQISCPDGGASTALPPSSDVLLVDSTKTVTGGRVCSPYVSFAVVSDPSQIDKMYQDAYTVAQTTNRGIATAVLGPGKTDGQYDLACLRLQCVAYPRWIRVDNVVIMTDSTKRDGLVGQLSDLGAVALGYT